jgi:hypothetical protein
VSDQDAKNSNLMEIVKRNGDFRKNYGIAVGAFLYLSSINAARGGISWWKTMLSIAVATTALWLKVRSGY